MAAFTIVENNPHFWLDSRLSSGVQTLYHSDYRYAKFRRPAQQFMLDVMMPSEFANDDAIDAIPDAIHWFERYYSGYHGKDGYPVFTKPSPERMEHIKNYMASCPSQSSISTFEHTGNLFLACDQAMESGYDTMADQRLFRARLRGDHISCEYFDDRAVVTILLFHLLDGEPLLRVRRIRAQFLRKSGELDTSLKARVSNGECDFHDVRDGFAATGTEFGFLFGGFESDMTITDFEWDTKSNRILGFSIVSDDLQDVQTFRLVMYPHDVDKLHNIYDVLSSDYDLPNAA
jgi:hypothetical protein